MTTLKTWDYKNVSKILQWNVYKFVKCRRDCIPSWNPNKSILQVSLSSYHVRRYIEKFTSKYAWYTKPLDKTLLNYTIPFWMYKYFFESETSHSFLSKSIIIIICVLLNEMLQTLMWKTSVCNQLTTQNVKISLSSVKILRENLNNLCLNLMFVMVIVFDLDALYIRFSYK